MDQETKEKVIKNLQAIATVCQIKEEKIEDPIESEMFADWSRDIYEAIKLIEIMTKEKIE